MITSLYSGASGMTAQQLKLDTISNNLANADTTGFKRVRPEFVDLIYQYSTVAGTPVSNQTSMVPTGVYKGLGTRIAATNRIFSEGNLEETDNPLDVAISGDGFFQIQLQDGSMGYTRDGGIKLDPNGNMITNTGLPYLPQVTVPSDAIQLIIGSDGVVAAELFDKSVEVLGQFTLVKFINPSGLQAMGDNIFKATQASGDPQEGVANQDGFGALRQGYLEKSNVNAVREMVGMISSQRAYELNSRSIQTADDILRTVSGLKR